MKPRILLVDDHDLVREGVKRLLDPDWEVCGEARNGKEAVEKALDLKPNLVLMDISMPVMNGIEATKEIRANLPRTKVILLSMHDSAQIERQGKEAGADAYLLKSRTAEDLLKAIHKVLEK